MDQPQILGRLSAIAAEIAAGQPPRVIFESIVEAVQSLGFDRVRLDLVSPDGVSIAPAAWRGYEGNGLGGTIAVSEDPDLAGLPEDGDAAGSRGFVPLLLRSQVIGKLACFGSNARLTRCIGGCRENGKRPAAGAATITVVTLHRYSLPSGTDPSM